MILHERKLEELKTFNETPMNMGQSEAVKAVEYDLRAVNNKARAVEAEAIRQAKNRFEAAETSFACYDLRNALNKVLHTNGINRQKFHCGQLNGNDSGMFLEKWPEIEPEFRRLYKTGYQPPRMRDQAEFHQYIDDFINSMTRIVDDMYVIKYFCYRDGYCTDHEKKVFRALNERLGDSWRDIAKWSVTIKMHMFESELPRIMEEFGNLVQFLEEGMESWHHIMKLLEARFSNQHTREMNQECIMHAVAMRSLPCIVEFANKLDSFSKRVNLDPAKVAAKLAKTEGRKVQAMARIERIIASLQL
jgi:hypothetical protein